MKTSLIDNKITYFKYKVMLKKKHIDKKIALIKKHANTYRIDHNELYAILVLEHVNRGSFITRFMEKIVVTFLTNIAVKFDLSIGIAQIKISTAKKIYPDSKYQSIARKLLNDDFNICMCAKIIKEYHLSPLEDNTLLGLVKNYLTGNVNTKLNTSIIIYYELMKWIVENSIISNETGE